MSLPWNQKEAVFMIPAVISPNIPNTIKSGFPTLRLALIHLPPFIICSFLCDPAAVGQTKQQHRDGKRRVGGWPWDSKPACKGLEGAQHSNGCENHWLQRCCWERGQWTPGHERRDIATNQADRHGWGFSMSDLQTSINNYRLHSLNDHWELTRSESMEE